MVRMQDVAREANVSLMTVSNVVNGRGKMSDSTRERVETAMQRLGYRVNRAARNLRTGKTGTIGLAVPDLDSWYMAHLTTRIVAAARDRGVTVAIEVTGASASGEMESLAHSRKLMYDGLILSVAGMTPDEVRVLQADHPLVIIGEGIPEAAVDRVALPNEEGGRLAAQHLLDIGCRRPALIMQREPDASAYSALRTRGFLDVLAAHGVPADTRLIVSPLAYSLDGGRDAARRLLEQNAPFDGVFVGTDETAIGVIRGFADAGVSVPGDVAVIGFDDVTESAFSVPTLSTVNPDHAFVAVAAVELLLERIEKGAAAGDPREIVHPARLLIRESSTRPRT